MSISARKITTFTKTIAALTDHPALGSTSLLKQWFDSSPEELRVALDGLIDDLLSAVSGSSGADNIGAGAITGLTGATVQSVIESLKTLVDAKSNTTDTYTQTAADARFETITDLTTVRKLSPTGDFTGTLNGNEIVAAEPGLSSEFVALQADVAQRAINVTVSPYAADNTGVADSTTTIQSALNAVSAAGGGIVFLPKGTYLVSSITVPDNITIFTAGKSTVIQQKTGTSVATHVIAISGSNIEIGDMSIIGNIATDTDEQNHGMVIQNAAAIVSNIRIGKVYGTNIRGDVVYIGGLSGFQVTNVKIDSVEGTNIYRNVVTIAGGEDIEIGSITGMQIGLDMFDVEPNSGNGNCADIRIKYIKGGTCSIVGYQSSVLAYGIEISHLNLDPSFQSNSSPAYASHNVAVGLTLRSCRGLYVGYYKANNFTDHAVKYIYSVGDLTGRNFIFNQINFVNCSTTEATFNAAMLLGSVDNTAINSGSVTVYNLTKMLIFGDSSNPTNVRVVIKNVTIDGILAEYVGYSTFENIFCNSVSDKYLLTQCQNCRLVNSQITLGRLAGNCTKLIIENTTATCATLVFDSSDDAHYVINSTLNTIYIMNGGYKRSYLSQMYFGGNYIWVDAVGKLRIKASAPTTDLDGTVVGTQT